MRNTEKTARKPAWQTVSDLTGAEGDLIARIPVFVVRGNREIEVEGCAGILEYDGERIVLETGAETCVVSGRGLTLGDFEDGFLRVRGEIGSICFAPEEDA